MHYDAVCVLIGRLRIAISRIAKRMFLLFEVCISVAELETASLYTTQRT